LVNDDRPFELKDERDVVSGLEERLALAIPRPTYEPVGARAPLAVGKMETVPAAADVVKLRAANS
jgi:hypothetical protein